MNWGAKLVIGMLLFMAFIVGLAFFMITSSSDDLIEADYYQSGLDYSKEFDSRNAAITDSVVPLVITSQAGLHLQFSSLASYTLTCKRLSNSSLDTVFVGLDSVISIDRTTLVPGPWQIQLKYRIHNKNYRLKREVVLP